MALQNYVKVPSQGVATDNDDVAVTDASGGVTLLEANPNRSSALIINTGAEDMRVTTDGSDPTVSHGKLIPKKAALSISGSDCPTAVVKAISVSATATSANASEVS